MLENNIKHNELLSNAYIIAKDFNNAIRALVNVTKISDDSKYDYKSVKYIYKIQNIKMPLNFLI